MTPAEFDSLQRTYKVGELLMPCCKGAAVGYGCSQGIVRISRIPSCWNIACWIIALGMAKEGFDWIPARTTAMLPAFLRGLTASTDATRTKLKADRDALTDQMAGRSESQVRRVAQRFALIGAAGELATSYGLTGWPAGEEARAAKTCFSQWNEKQKRVFRGQTLTVLLHEFPEIDRPTSPVISR